jgi:formate dehydrogenase iron-sulfur subunit
MSVNRRKFIKLTGLGMGGLLLAPQGALASEAGAGETQASMLYDTTECVGCRACQNACRSWNGTTIEQDPSGLYDAPMDLSGDTWTVIQLHEGDGARSFVKHQCMHCLNPACVSVCPVAALEKTPEGPVVYDATTCIGCRYCMTACPFGIPRYEWDEALPLIVKCTFCADRLTDGLEPACAAACPTGALIFGRRGEMLATAEGRLQDSPEKYVDRVYGKEEAGGTSVLYLSHVPFEDLGFPTLSSQALPDLTWPYLLSAPGVFFGVGGLMTAIYWITKRRVAAQEEG